MVYESHLIDPNGKAVGYFYSHDTLRDARLAAPKREDIPAGHALVFMRTSCATGKYWILDIVGCETAAQRSKMVSRADGDKRKSAAVAARSS